MTKWEFRSGNNSRRIEASCDKCHCQAVMASPFGVFRHCRVEERCPESVQSQFVHYQPPIQMITAEEIRKWAVRVLPDDEWSGEVTYEEYVP